MSVERVPPRDTTDDLSPESPPAVSRHDTPADANDLAAFKADQTWLARRFRCCARMNSSWVFIVYLCLFAVFQGAVVSGVFPSAISSLERRYGLSSTQTGLLSSIYDVVVLVMCPVISILAGKPESHKPRVLALSSIIIGVGALLFVTPQMSGSAYAPPASSALERLLCGDYDDAGTPCGAASSAALALFTLAMLFIGLGASPLFTLGPACIDAVTPKQSTTVALGVFYAGSMLGPALGFVVASAGLGVWVDLGQSPDALAPGDKHWVGAWWIGYVIAGIALLLTGTFMLALPRHVGTPEQQALRALELHRERVAVAAREAARRGRTAASHSADGGGDDDEDGATSPGESYNGGDGTSPDAGVGSHGLLGAGAAAAASDATADSDSIGTSDPAAAAAAAPAVPSAAGSLAVVKSLIRNKPFLWTSIGAGADAFAVTGFATFLPKGAESLFGISASYAALAVGLCVIPGATGGILTGGLLMRRWRLRAVATAKLTSVIAAVAAVLTVGFFIGCGTAPVAGVTVPYSVSLPAQSRQRWSSLDTVSPTPGLGALTSATAASAGLAAVCNADCGCGAEVYAPVCGADGIQYYSPCHAGCTEDTSPEAAGGLESVAAKYANCACVTGAAAVTATVGQRPPNISSPLRPVLFPASRTQQQQMGGTATDGRCGSDCDLLVPFLLVLFLMMFATFLNNIPATTVVLKAVPHAQRTLAMGLQNFIFRLLGAVPAPLVFGALVDSACVLRERRCGADGGCLEYDNWQLRVTFVLLGLVPKAAACACYALGWWHFDSPYEDDDNDDGFDADTQQAGVGTGPGAGEVELGQLSALQQ